MPVDKAARKFFAFPLGGVLNEGRTPSKVQGLTACSNLLYRRFGAWGKRAGSGIVYQASTTGSFPLAPVSGIRWYRTSPSLLTKLVISAQGALWGGGDPGTPSAPSALSKITDFSSSPTVPVSFCSVYDPALGGGATPGGDILIICGATTSNLGVAQASIAPGAFSVGDTAQVQVVGPATVTTPAYTVLATDNAQSVALQLITLLNQSAAVIPGTPFLAQAFAQAGNLDVGALVSGSAGNSYTVQIIKNGMPVGSPVAFTFGGTATIGPLKYDGTTLTALSYQITKGFTGCVTWHDHVWFWGDPANPNTLYASDLNMPESFAFMVSNGPYQIGLGDGDPGIQTCIPIGNVLYVFKTNSIYAITGYDFQTGEYEFQVQPAVRNHGIPSSECATSLNDTIVFWSGSSFERLFVGATETEIINRPIPITSGKISAGNQKIIRAVAGDFAMQSLINGSFPGVGTSPIQVFLTNVALFAVDTGGDVANTVMVFDDDASKALGDYAWAPWSGSGWNIAAWIPFPGGENAAGTGLDTPALYWVQQPGNTPIKIIQYGQHPTQDPAGFSIPWFAQTGWIDMGSPSLLKELHRVYLDLETLPGAFFVVSALAAGPVNGVADTIYPPAPYNSPLTVGTAGQEAGQVLVVKANPFLKGYKFMLNISNTSNQAAFELVGITLDALEEAYQ
jgi:hypothetical protein